MAQILDAMRHSTRNKLFWRDVWSHQKSDNSSSVKPDAAPRGDFSYILRVKQAVLHNGIKTKLVILCIVSCQLSRIIIPRHQHVSSHITSRQRKMISHLDEVFQLILSLQTWFWIFAESSDLYIWTMENAWEIIFMTCECDITYNVIMSPWPTWCPVKSLNIVYRILLTSEVDL